jgi:murein DD-endopeptidase MepM/ murein hydrolase activator NlpD
MKLLLMTAIVFFGIGAYLAVKPPSAEPKNNLIAKPEIRTEEVSVSILPEKIEQGDPALIVINGTTTVSSLKFNGRPLETFIHEGKLSALVGFDLRGSTGSFPIELELPGGESIKSKLAVGERFIAKAPLGIPDKLGGDTPEAEQELIESLVQEGKLISSIKTSNTKLWDGKFQLPLKGEIVITDTYGYSRLTGASTISHKGTDFRAKVGTPVYAMNSGKVAFVRFLRNYGHTIAIDHGLGLLTIYMHLSQPLVKEGQTVGKGDLIAKSGDTGYVLGPHLHLTIRINNISIDPEKFMAIFGE